MGPLVVSHATFQRVGSLVLKEMVEALFFCWLHPNDFCMNLAQIDDCSLVKIGIFFILFLVADFKYASRFLLYEYMI